MNEVILRINRKCQRSREEIFALVKVRHVLGKKRCQMWEKERRRR